MYYYIWIPATIILFALQAWLSVKVNQQGGKWLWAMYGFGIMFAAVFPVWIYVARYSQRLLFDGALFDNLIFLTYILTLMCLGEHAKLSSYQWTGLGLVVVGSILMRANI